MVIYLLLKGFDAILFAIISALPVLETPAWFATQLPDVLFRIASFNWYLPIYETIAIILGLIYITLNYKIIKIVLSFFVDLNA